MIVVVLVVDLRLGAISFQPDCPLTRRHRRHVNVTTTTTGKSAEIITQTWPQQLLRLRPRRQRRLPGPSQGAQGDGQSSPIMLRLATKRQQHLRKLIGLNSIEWPAKLAWSADLNANLNGQEKW